MRDGIGSFLLTGTRAFEAIDAVYPMFRDAAQKGLVKRDQLHIVVMDPGIPFTSGIAFEDAILCEMGWANPPEKYMRVARQKAEVTWRTGIPSLVVQQMYPHLLTADNTKWGGSWIHQNIVVACSGVEEYMDQLFSQTIAATCAALTTREMRRAMVADNVVFMRQMPDMDILL